MIKQRTISNKVFDTFNTLFLAGLVILCILPFMHVAAISFSAPGPAAANIVGIWPIGFNLEAYKEAFHNKQIIAAMINSFKRVLLGVLVNMILTILVAYPLSKEKDKFPGKQFYIWILIITMLFNGGLIPMYLLIKDLGLRNTIWALVLPSAVPVFNITVLLNFFRQIPKEIEEAASIDGATHFKSLVKIYLPLSIPSLATLTLFCMIGHWNAWFDGLIYMTDPLKYPMTTYLQVLLTKLRNVQSLEDAIRMARTAKRSLMMAYVLISILPIMCAYPFMQKHVKTGLVLGSVKG